MNRRVVTLVVIVSFLALPWGSRTAVAGAARWPVGREEERSGCTHPCSRRREHGSRWGTLPLPPDTSFASNYRWI